MAAVSLSSCASRSCSVSAMSPSSFRREGALEPTGAAPVESDQHGDAQELISGRRTRCCKGWRRVDWNDPAACAKCSRRRRSASRKTESNVRMKSAWVSVVPPLLTRRKISATRSSSTSCPICTARDGKVLEAAQAAERIANCFSCPSRASPVRARKTLDELVDDLPVLASPKLRDVRAGTRGPSRLPRRLRQTARHVVETQADLAAVKSLNVLRRPSSPRTDL